jgi:hypothetical protein
MLEIAAEHLLPAMLSELSEYAVRKASRAALQAHAGRRQRSATRGEALAVVEGATVLSSVPGRLRLRLSWLRGDAHRARDIELRLAGFAGVHRTHANTLTGSFLVEYDPAIARLDRICATLVPGARTWLAS